jgi:hypothetical protein
MRATTQVLSGLVGKMVMIQKGDIRHEGMLTARVDRRVEGTKRTVKRWELFTVDEMANTSEFHFALNEGWTVTVL